MLDVCLAEVECEGLKAGWCRSLAPHPRCGVAIRPPVFVCLFMGETMQAARFAYAERVGPRAGAAESGEAEKRDHRQRGAYAVCAHGPRKPSRCGADPTRDGRRRDRRDARSRW